MNNEYIICGININNSVLLLDFKVLQYLLKSCVLDSVGVIVVIDDLKVTNCLPWAWCCKMHLRLSLASSLCVDGEVGWSAHLHSWNTRVYLSVLSVRIKSHCLYDINVLNWVSVANLRCLVICNISHLSCWVQDPLLSPCQHHGKDPLLLWMGLLEFPDKANHEKMNNQNLLIKTKNII